MMNPQDDTPPGSDKPSDGGLPPPSAAPAAAAPAATPAATAAATPTPAPAMAAAPAPSSAPVVALATLERTVDTLARELMRERRQERRWRTFFRLAWLGLFISLIWFGWSDRGQHTPPTGPHTALVELRGEIAVDSDASADQVISGLRQAFEDQGAVAVVMRINSPGGSPVQAGMINDEVRRLKALHQKKFYVVVEEICASGAYYVAVAADEIFVDKASIVGSIGVLMDGFGFNGIMDKVGVERRLITAGENKAMLDPFTEQSPKHKAYAQAMIDQIHQQFISTVRQGRGAKLKEDRDTFSGLFWNGEEAVRLGLADKLGNVDYVAREVVKAEELIDYTPRDNVAERLAKRFGAALGAGAVRAAGGLVRVH